MKVRHFFGVVVAVVGIGCIGHWIDRTFFQPTAADRAFIARMADVGGGSLSSRHGPAFIYFLVGVVAMKSASKLFE